MKPLSKKDFDKIINQGNIIIDFWASWCEPCRRMSYVLDEVYEKYKKNIAFYKVNVDDESQLTSQYAIMSIPTIIYFIDGNVCDRTIGVASTEEIENKIKQIYKETV